jgi:hypothetical protein
MEVGKRRRKRHTAILIRKIFLIERKISRLETHLKELHGSPISGSYSYQQTASHIEEKIKQKREAIITLVNNFDDELI